MREVRHRAATVLAMSAALHPDEIHERYRLERDKRLRSDGNDQYRPLSDVFGESLDDPYMPVVDREPLFDEVTVVCIGGGFSGLLTGARLKEAGVERVRIIDKAGDFGGTWYWNRYPGAQCDTAAFIYLPLLEETGHMPSEKYTKGPEILEHSQRIGRQYNLYEDALFSTEVRGLEWLDDEQKWLVRTNRGDEIRAKYVTMGPGPLHKPKLPGIEGIESFEGHSFHTSRWDYDYTGGDPTGGKLEGLADKRVGIIGTGATSVQCIPHLARAAGELYVFQRTPSSIDVRNNTATDPEWFSTLEPGWQQKWMENFTLLQTGGFADEDLVMDGWTDISQRIRDRALANADFTPEGLLRAYHESDDEKMAEIRNRVDTIVDDGATAEALKPWYRQLCKRPCFHDEYLQAFNEPTAHLVDTDGQGVERVDATGVIAAGEYYELDCLIYASGFEVGTEFSQRWGYDTIGRDGQALSEYWGKGMRSLHGMHVHGFPNMFVVSPSQAANLISNIPHNLSEAAITLATIIRHAEETGAAVVETEEHSEADWLRLLEEGGRTFGGNADCTPGYYNGEGQPADEEQQRFSLGYPDGPVAFFEFIAKWREEGSFAGLRFG